jgi:hypothetical protein
MSPLAVIYIEHQNEWMLVERPLSKVLRGYTACVFSKLKYAIQCSAKRPRTHRLRKQCTAQGEHVVQR